MVPEPADDGSGADDGRDGAAAVELTDVRRTYQLGEPVHALDGVDLTIPKGSYTAVMGPSGSGKSTLMNLIGSLDSPTEGSVRVNGREVTTLSEDEKADLRGTEIGFVFQTFNLMPRQTAAENVALPMIFQGAAGSERRERATELLTRVGLGGRVDHQPNELSGGQRQRVAIARAMVNDPAIVLADEPTGNLDSTTGEQIMGLFEELYREGQTMLMVTHERHIAEHAERVIHLLDGKIERIETIEDRRTPDTEADPVDPGVAE